MNFKELIKKKVEQKREFNNVDFSNYEQGALMAREAIIELLEKVNDGNFDEISGEPLNDECEAEILTIGNLIHLIKESKDYE